MRNKYPRWETFNNQQIDETLTTPKNNENRNSYRGAQGKTVKIQI